MGKAVHNDVLDAALDYIANYCDVMYVCSNEPTTYALASSTYMLADITLTPGDGNGDFTVQDGVTSGRRLTVSEQANESVTTTGTANHIALCDVSESKVLLYTSCVSTPITSDGTVTVQTWDYEIRDPA